MTSLNFTVLFLSIAIILGNINMWMLKDRIEKLEKQQSIMELK